MNRGGPMHRGNMNRGGGASMSRGGGNRGHPNQVGLIMILLHHVIQFVFSFQNI